jgi:hypothetical protein
MDKQPGIVSHAETMSFGRAGEDPANMISTGIRGQSPVF